MNLVWSSALSELDLGTKQGLFLRYLSRHGSASQADLSRATLTDPAAVNRALDSLENRGWVTRADDPKDRRRWIVGLTPEGRRAAIKIEGIYKRVADTIFCDLESNERKMLHSFLRRLLEKGLPPDVQKELTE